MTMVFTCPMNHHTDARAAETTECPRCFKTFIRLQSIDLTKELQANELYLEQRHRKADDRKLLPKESR